MKKLRLLITKKCEKNCKECCNKNLDLDALPVVSTFQPYEEIMLTGGEPMLEPMLVSTTIDIIHQQSNAKIYIYTSLLSFLFISFICRADGATITLHDQEDYEQFKLYNDNLCGLGKEGKSIHVNVFNNVDITGIKRENLIIKYVDWTKDCPLPKDEVFMRI